MVLAQILKAEPTAPTIPAKSTTVDTLLISSKEWFVKYIKSAPVKKFVAKIKNVKRVNFKAGLFWV